MILSLQEELRSFYYQELMREWVIGRGKYGNSMSLDIKLRCDLLQALSACILNKRG